MFKATWKSLLSRKLRLLLSGMAVVLGVMAVSSALILTDSLSASFDDMFRTVNANVDVQVSGVSAGGENGSRPEPLPASAVERVRAVSGVASAVGDVSADGARVVGRNGKVIVTQGPPRLGMAWRDGGGIAQMRTGTGPKADDQVAINALLAKQGPFAVGDRIEVLTLAAKRSFTVSGVFGMTGNRDSLGGETVVAFTEPVAQRLMLGKEGVYSSIDVRAAAGVTPAVVKANVAAALGSSGVVRTSAEVAKAQAKDVQQFLTIFQNFLLGFAAVTLFVGIFLILNTFSILVAQRTRELALLRSLGAGRGQVIRSVLVEALVVGVVASTLGLFAGYGVALLLKQMLFSSLADATLGFTGSAVAASYLVGVLVTLVAAVVPALRASRVAPIAALRDAATADKSLVKVTLVGGILGAVGAGGVGWALFGSLKGNAIWGVLLTGVLLTFIGVALLTPSVARPTVGVIGRLFSWSLPGKLGRRNSARNPRRTANTAAALMIGLALITGVSVLAASIQASMSKVFTRDLRADLVIDRDSGDASYDASVIDKTRRMPGVAAAVGLYGDVTTDVTGKTVYVTGTDLAVAKDLFNLKVESGELRDLRHNEVVVGEEFAAKRGLGTGSSLRLRTSRAGEQTFVVVGVYAKQELLSEPLMSVADAEEYFQVPSPALGAVRLAPGADAVGIRKQIEALLVDSPEVNVASQADFIKQQTGQVDTLLNMLYALLALAVLIAILGIVNTLALSVLERTRELGMLRAVGMSRWSAMRMITVESVVISVFGALLGLAVGTGLGVAVVRALKGQGFDVLSVPWTRMLLFLGLSVVVGLFAAILPAIRAARVNVLQAISYE
ncbi:ABC transporter [Longispora fulva]|uniref:Putative ABC transport system permease protein n=1 Tax=Longispora fulva TaxID=619741 RepID=A0A8J7GAN4_9ACTN|nr:FtsX-like permease family protein [Longispora fulva]MBG6135460.1 putative ABC transport system permease protein [Longispora fulva]GIG56298.1 ABC transporter [Longispora fulva]